MEKTPKDVFYSRRVPSGIEQDFVYQVLQKHGKIADKAQRRTIQRFNLEKTRALKHTRVITYSKERQFGGRMSMKFPIYMRFMDMKRIRRNGVQVRQKQKWLYNKILFARFNQIVWETQTGLTDEVIEKLAIDLEIKIPV